MLKEKISHLQKLLHLLQLLGKPCCGKSKLGKVLVLLAKDYNVGRIVISDMIRENIKARTPIGLELEKYKARMGARKLAPCELIIPALGDRIIELQKEGVTRIIIDGAPRTETQAKAIYQSRVPTEMLELDISDTDAILREEARAKIEQREDNGLMREGLKTFHNDTVPAIRFYKKHGLHGSIDAMKTMHEKVHEALILMHFRSHEVKAMLNLLNDPENEARVLIDEIEGKRKPKPRETKSWQNTSWFRAGMPQQATA